MKKFLVTVLAVLFAMSSFAIVSFAAEPIVVDFTDPDICAAMELCDTGAWAATSLATGSYDETEDAFKIEFTQTMGQWKSLYFEISNYAKMDKSQYGLIGYYYKASGFGELSGPCGMSDGGAGIGDRKIDMNTDTYKWVTWTTESFAGERIIPSIYSEGSEVPAGAVYYLKAVVLFPDQAAFDAFDIDAYLGNGTSEPETSEPAASEPETSEPAASEPETSEPAASEPENSEAEKPNTNTSDVAIISGAILLCAAAATVVAVSRKRK